MKTARRILTLTLALFLAFSLMIPVMAAEANGTITVTRPANATGNGTTYEIYKIFNTTKVEGGYTYQLTDAWENFTAEGYFEVKNDHFILWKKNPNTVADAAAVAQLAKQYVADNHLTTTDTVTAGGEAKSMAPGYYLLLPEEGPCGVVMVKAGVDSPIQEKTTAAGHPTVEKLVFEDSTNRYQNFNTVDVGQTIQFQTIINVGAGAENYILHDKMDSHIQYTNAFVLLRDGNALPEFDTSVQPQKRNYEVIENPGCEDGCTFHVVFSEHLCSSLHKNAKIVVQYTGKLKQGAETQTAHDNTTWLTYKNGVPSNVSSTHTATFSVTVFKKDQAGNALGNATFVLKDNVGQYYGIENGKVVWGSLENATKLTTTVNPDDATDPTNGIVVFDGVDAENFVLEEIVVPNGYTGQSSIDVSTKVGDTGNGENEYVEVTNQLGMALPETGGIGTTVFYIMGGVLVLGALAVLTIFKRRNAQ